MGILERIVEAKRAEVEQECRAVPLRRVIEKAAGAGAPRDFAGALRSGPGDRPAVIAEIKRASPSRGGIQEGADPGAVAHAYAAAGAAAISVLTESRFFLGAPQHLEAAKAAAPVPILRKDFIIDEYQVYQSRVLGADGLLLIARLLDAKALATLTGVARAMHMEALVEVHDADEIARAVDAGARVIGVNNRDLATFAVSIDTALRLAERLPEGIVKVSESGVETHADLVRLRAAGYDAVLVGERLMREADPGAALRALLAGET